MKVLILTTFEKYGGAAIAAGRLHRALQKSGVDVQYGFATQWGKKSPSIHIQFTNKTLTRWRFWTLFSLERLRVLLHISERKWLYKYSFGNSGLSILDRPAVLNADVIHLHWVNFGFLSLDEIVRLSKVKPVVWTYHDYWPMTGGCHLPQSCVGFKLECRSCFYLKKGSKLSNKNLISKTQSLNEFQGKLVAVSQWMAEQASQSTPLKSKKVDVIGNVIDTEVFKPIEKHFIRFSYGVPEKARCVLVGAADLTDENKGFAYFLQAIALVKSEFHLLIFGILTNPSIIPSGLSFTVIGPVFGESKLAEVYNLADVFVLPSLQESLSYMTMEAMACGKPVVAFDSGGVRDLVLDGETGFLIESKNTQKMAEAISQLLDSVDLTEKLGQNARKHVETNFSEPVVATKYKKLYESFL